MSKHTATIMWSMSPPDTGNFLKGRYSREHTWTFDGGITLPASSSPSVVPVPFSSPDAVDPEEAYVAAISSCHMLTFLYIVAKAGYAVTAYKDIATGIMGTNNNGIKWIEKVELNPVVTYGDGKYPSPEEIEDFHHRAHLECFIANSVKTAIEVK